MLLTSLCAAGPASIPASTPPARPAHIILIRHAEKPADPNNPHLSRAGVKRAHRLVSFIRTDPAMTTLGLPVAIFATRTTKDGNGQRTQETVAPLASALGLRVQTPFLGKEYASLAEVILRESAYAGKTVLICWNRENIPPLLAALGATDPRKWKESVYDRVEVISYRDRTATLTTYHYDSH